MKVSVCFLSALAGLILNVASSKWISAAAEDGNSEMERIVGGSYAAEGQFPWAAVLFRNGDFICTCSIIGARTVLTAAHCVRSDGVTRPASEFHAIANLRRSSTTVRIQFNRLTAHPNYTENGVQNDIAIFNTIQPITFSQTVQPICIARRETDPRENETVLAMGWGATSRSRFFPSYPDRLKYVEQNVTSSSECNRFYGGSLEDSKICAGDTISGICNGDSGGPLVKPGADTRSSVQVGVASYGHLIFGCGLLAPSVWTRVSYFSDFIKQEALGDTICER